ncbi:MAG: Rpn family recombination-promoting nuclease/putative transposase [Lyngbya sp.]|nr:Rpn family recombination-promoting nuclease/putative transposase [Lyngbya sp.]
MRFINPKTDFAFKKIFGSTESKDILISFLNALIYNAEPVIEDLEIIDPYLSPRIQGLKDSYLDVKAKLNDGSIVIIEMQVLNVESFGKRVLYNAAKTYSLQLESGQGYRFLKPVIALTITDFIMFEESERLISRFVFKEESENFKYKGNEIDLIFIELPKFNKELEELESLTDKWIYFLKSAMVLESVPENMENIPAIQRAFQIANQANLSREELEEQEKKEMFIQDQQGMILLAEREGLERGRERGLAEGRERGLAEGREEGREEGSKAKAIEIARQLLNVLDDETISQTTGLSIEEIQNLR